MKIGLIGGYSLNKALEDCVEIPIKNDCVGFEDQIGDKTVYFIPRHGKNHEFPPHKVPEKDYFEFLKKKDVKDLIAVYSVGVINEKWDVPCLAIINDFMDFTGEVTTIYDKFDKDEPMHVDMDEPYFIPYQKSLEKIIKNSSDMPIYSGIYAQMTGPRFETKAEIRALNTLGADMVGMTHSQEATLAKEFDMRLLSLGMGVNYACGIKGTQIRNQSVLEDSKNLSEKTAKIIKEFVEEL